MVQWSEQQQVDSFKSRLYDKIFMPKSSDKIAAKIAIFLIKEKAKGNRI
jgi:hypothetical protein